MSEENKNEKFKKHRYNHHHNHKSGNGNTNGNANGNGADAKKQNVNSAQGKPVQNVNPAENTKNVSKKAIQGDKTVSQGQNIQGKGPKPNNKNGQGKNFKGEKKDRSGENKNEKAPATEDRNENSLKSGIFTDFSDSAKPSYLKKESAPELVIKHEYYNPPKSDVEYGKDVPFTDFSTAFSVSGFDTPDADTKGGEIKEGGDDGGEKVTVIGIKFRSSSKVYYFDPDGVKYVPDTFAIVDTARGVEYGYVASGNFEVPVSSVVSPLRKAIRPATKADKDHFAENCAKEKEAEGIWAKKVAEHDLFMKLVDVEYTFDNSKLLFYFTAEGRVDFRELVKDLASLFRCRIELRQMGIRDEAKILGGLGICGRPLCCATFLPDFAQVSIKMAKEQTISLNSTKISGNCGRLMCCLRFEHETYADAIRKCPPVDSLVRTPVGDGVIVEAKPLLELVKVKLDANPDAVPSVFKLDELTVLKKSERKPDDDEE